MDVHDKKVKAPRKPALSSYTYFHYECFSSKNKKKIIITMIMYIYRNAHGLNSFTESFS